MPALFDRLRHPPRLSAGFHRHTAAWNACEVLLESLLFHPQPELFAHFAARIQNADIAVLVAQIDSDVKGEVSLSFLLALARHLLLAGILLHSRSPICTSSAFPIGSLTHPAGRPALSSHLCVKDSLTDHEPDPAAAARSSPAQFACGTCESLRGF